MANNSKAWISDRLHQQLNEYSSYHKNPTNKKLHLLGIPLIAFSLLGLLSLVKLFPIHTYQTADGPVLDLGQVILALGGLWYIFSGRLWGFGITLIFAAFYYFAHQLSWPLNLAIFAVGWVLQLWGHKSFEKKSPAFTKNLEHLLVGPMWIFMWVFKKI